MSAPPDNSDPRRGAIRLAHLITAVSIAVAAVLLYYSLRGIEWSRVWEIIRSAKIRWVVAAAAGSSFSLFLRACRWRILLRAEGDVSLGLAFSATSAGYFGNSFLPARAGEVVRTMMIHSRSTLSKTFVLTTALSERVSDAIALITISALVLLTLPQQPGWLAHARKPLTILGIGGMLAIAFLPSLGPALDRIVSALPIGDSTKIRLSQMLHQVILGVRTFHNARRLSGFVALTGLIWCMDAAGAVVLALSLDMALALPVALLLLAGLGLGSALPSTPGYVGIYQFVAISVLTPFGFAQANVIAFILLLQALGYVVITCWGLLAFVRHRKTG